MSLFDEIRGSCAEVSRRARFVRIDDEGIEAFAEELVPEVHGPTPALDPAHHHRGDDASTLAFVLIMDAINFGSGWFPHLRKRPGASGYLTLASSLAERFDREGVIAPAQLREMDAYACAALFGQDPSEAAVAELMALFARAWRDLGEHLRCRHGDRFEGIVESAGGRAEALVRELALMPLYRDVARYDELRVPLYKRAQITASDLAHAFEERGPGAFVDLEGLTLFADNLVPHVLRCAGVLSYRADLAARIDAGARLLAGSAEEVEIRAVALHAVERLASALASRGAPIQVRHLDGLLWSRGQSPAIKARPRHRARSVYY